MQACGAGGFKTKSKEAGRPNGHYGRMYKVIRHYVPQPNRCHDQWHNLRRGQKSRVQGGHEGRRALKLKRRRTARFRFRASRRGLWTRIDEIDLQIESNCGRSACSRLSIMEGRLVLLSPSTFWLDRTVRSWFQNTKLQHRPLVSTIIPRLAGVLFFVRVCAPRTPTDPKYPHPLQTHAQSSSCCGSSREGAPASVADTPCCWHRRQQHPPPPRLPRRSSLTAGGR